MQGNIDGFWGKLNESPLGGISWHPLAEHCLDVAAVIRALLRRGVLRRRLARLGGQDDLTPAQVARLCWLAFLHDIGKLNWGFQSKAFPQRKDTTGHVEAVAALVAPANRQATRSALRWSEMADWVEDEETLFCLFRAAICHHGTPVNWDDPPGLIRYWKPAYGLDPMAGLAQLAAIGAQALPEAFGEGGPALPSAPEFQHAFAGLVTAADWIASTEAFFPYAEPGDGARWTFARARAEDVLAVLPFVPDKAEIPGDLPAALGLAPPRPMQTQVAQRPLGAEGEILLIEAETGSGKTEAALLHFLRLFAAGEVDGLYFALPTRSAAVQIHGRIEGYVQRVFGALAPPVLLAVPGYLDPSVPEAGGLAGEDALWPDDESWRRQAPFWVAERPKRYLAAPIAVGTIDQALLAVVKARHAHMRHTLLLRHLLVVDEVHSSDPYMAGLLETLLDSLRAAGGRALLMSATLGAATRERLLQGRRQPPSPEAAEAAPYPALTIGGGEPAEVAGVGTGRRIALDARPLLDDAPAVAALARGAAMQGARVLVIRNTVARAIATQEALEAVTDDPSLLFRCQGEATLHHSRFAPSDRRLLDAAVETALGKGAPGATARPVVVVGTQTLEQALDIDADFLITDLCPIDVLLQRLGRLHRHDRPDRPAAFNQPRCVVLEPADGLGRYLDRPGDGFGLKGERAMAYPDLRILEATRRLIAAYSLFDLPAMNRHLVERGTHPQRMAALAKAEGPAWQRHEREVLGLGWAQGSIARLNAIDRTESYCALGPFDALGSKIATRLGANDHRLTLASTVIGPFGTPVDTLTLPAWMAGGPPEGATPETSGTAPLRFTYADRSFVYDRWGLRRD